jgi:hypothetical protein
MLWVMATLIACAVGVVVGCGSERLPLRPVVQSLTAAFAAMPIAAFATMLVSAWTHPDDGAYWGIGLERESVLFWAALAVAVIALHGALRWFGQRSPPVARHRAVICGTVGALYGALPIAWALTIVRGLVHQN